eukprot:scaffold300_cov258-Pinguiococcus_pyrenoidosus.AAC.33
MIEDVDMASTPSLRKAARWWRRKRENSTTAIEKACQRNPDERTEHASLLSLRESVSSSPASGPKRTPKKRRARLACLLVDVDDEAASPPNAILCGDKES